MQRKIYCNKQINQIYHGQSCHRLRHLKKGIAVFPISPPSSKLTPPARSILPPSKLPSPGANYPPPPSTPRANYLQQYIPPASTYQFPKSAIFIDTTRSSNYFSHSNYWFVFLYRGLNRNLRTCRGGLDSKTIRFDPCVYFLIVQMSEKKSINSDFSRFSKSNFS